MPEKVQTGNAIDAPAGTATFELRHGTQDKEVFTDVVVNNQYRLPDSLPEGSIVVDIGANVGAFAVACLMRGAGTVVCFEPDPNNYAQLLKNVSYWPGQAPCFNAAVWRSDRKESVEYVGDYKATACGGIVLKGNNSNCGSFKIPVESMGLNDLLFYVTDGGKAEVDILKVDTEGSEYPILYTCDKLRSVKKLLVETHECTTIWPQDKVLIAGYPTSEACSAGMERFLRFNGFDTDKVAESAENSICNIIFATRKEQPIKTLEI